MRYFSYGEYDPESTPQDYVVTVSEDDLRETYYPYWYKRMCDKFGQEKVDSTWGFEDFLYEWIVVHWAWESTNV